MDYSLFKKSSPTCRISENVFGMILDIPGRKIRTLYVAGLLVLLFSGSCLYFMNPQASESHQFLPMTFNLLLMTGLWIWHKSTEPKPRNWLTPDTFFFVIYSLFHFTYMVYFSFGIVPLDPEVFFAADKVMRAYYFCVVCLSAFLLGYEMMVGFFPGRLDIPALEPVPHSYIALSKLLILVAIVFFWGVILKTGIGTLANDYDAMRYIGYSAGGRFYGVSTYIGLVSVAMYCAASGLTYQKFMHGPVFMILTLFYICGILLTGNRSHFLYFAVVPIMAFHYFFRKIKVRYAIIGILTLFFVMGAIAVTRRAAVLDIGKMVEAFQNRESSDQNLIEQNLLEFGTTIKTVVFAMSLVPEQHPYWYGKSYLDSIEICVPNIIPGTVRVSRGIGVWLTETVTGLSIWETHGRGGSIAMEAYVNFGFIGGAVSFVILGMFYRLLYERFLAKPTFIRTVILFCSVSVLVLWIRNTSNTFSRTIVWSIIAAWLMQLILGNRHRQMLSEESVSNYPEEESNNMADERV